MTSMAVSIASAEFTAEAMHSSLLRANGSTDTDEAPEHNPDTRFNSSSRLAERISRAPARAKRFARASPIPLEAPVIQTTFLWKRDCNMLSMVLQQFTRAQAGTVTMTIRSAFSYCRVVVFLFF